MVMTTTTRMVGGMGMEMVMAVAVARPCQWRRQHLPPLWRTIYSYIPYNPNPPSSVFMGCTISTSIKSMNVHPISARVGLHVGLHVGLLGRSGTFG